jgi:hypothetical protein
MSAFVTNTVAQVQAKRRHLRNRLQKNKNEPMKNFDPLMTPRVGFLEKRELTKATLSTPYKTVSGHFLSPP